MVYMNDGRHVLDPFSALGYPPPKKGDVHRGGLGRCLQKRIA